jgi:membrane-bound lytic murein transglycosylase B
MRRSRAFLPGVALAVALFLPQAGRALSVSEYPQLKDFIEEMASQHGFERSALREMFARVQLREGVVRAMEKPAERLPWYRYREIFVHEDNIENGLAFWRRNAEILTRVEREYGVPAPVVVAIVGVETRYGRNMGSHPILDSLTTLMLLYPRRSDFFRSELKQFLLLARDEGIDPGDVVGSYAGAMGYGQFMPSSYRQYAVDYDADRRRDLINNPADAIGSVANYLSSHRWRRGDPVYAPAFASAPADELLSRGREPRHTLEELRRAGVRVEAETGGGTRAGLVSLETRNGTEYRVAFPNFYVIMRYNNSINYAMAVAELGEQIRKRRAAI